MNQNKEGKLYYDSDDILKLTLRPMIPQKQTHIAVDAGKSDTKTARNLVWNS